LRAFGKCGPTGKLVETGVGVEEHEP
jgi:hypothetical protein